MITAASTASLSQPSPLDALIPGATGLTRTPEAFQRMLLDAAAPALDGRPDGESGPANSDEAKPAIDPRAREAAMQMIASTFIVPVLSEARQGEFLEEPFAPGDSERRFGPLFDQELADRIVHAAEFPMLDSILRRYPRFAQPAAAAQGGVHVVA
jgi:hypothetical protein